MTLRRFNRKIKSRAEKGKPGQMARHIVLRVRPGEPNNRMWEFHFAKGWRRRA
jgi:hypothetical protein